MSQTVARTMWERFEPVHQLVYFAPEVREAADGLGCAVTGWGYFALRAAPLGPAPAAVVTSCFHVFHPDRVARALPDAWEFASPQQVLRARERAVAAAMTGLYGADVVASANWPRPPTSPGGQPGPRTRRGACWAPPTQALPRPRAAPRQALAGRDHPA